MASGGKLKAAAFSIGVNAILLASKFAVALLTNSIGLYAESAHSFFDLFSSALAYLGIRKAEEPSDHTHNFGHEKFETLSSSIQALFILATACVVIAEGLKRLINPSTAVEFSEGGIILMLISIPIAHFTSQYLDKTAKREGSQALEADSAHFSTDVLSSISVLVGLILVKFGFPIGDPLGAIVVGLIMLHVSISLLASSFRVFMDFSPDGETMAAIRSVLEREKRITRFHKLRARLAGSKILVDVHIHVSHAMPIATAHSISHELENAIIRDVPEVKEVNVHIEPD